MQASISFPDKAATTATLVTVLSAAAVLCLSASPASNAGDAYGQLVEVITGRGNVFVVDLNEYYWGDGSMIDGLGINSRMIHGVVSGSIIHGQNQVGTERSMRPYMDMPSNTGFVATLDDTKSTRYYIPKMYRQYDFDGTGLQEKPGADKNILGYSDSRTVSGNLYVSSVDDGGITVSGNGRLILKINNMGKSLLEGSASPGTTIRIVHSPYDLMATPYDASRGFLVSHVASDPGPKSLRVLVGSVNDSVKSGIFQYVQSAELRVYHGKCCKGAYTESGQFTITTGSSLLIDGDPNGYYVVTGDTTDPVTMDPYSITKPGAKILSVEYNTVGAFEHWVYDTFPVRQQGPTMEGVFDAEFGSISDAYLVIDSPGGTSTIGAIGISGKSFLVINGLDQGTVYKVTSGSNTAVAGISGGTVRVESFTTPSHRVAMWLYLYDESIVHTNDDGHLGMLVIDHANEETFEIPNSGDLAYNVHAYVKIPVIGDVTIRDMALDGLMLPYLDGTYGTGDSILVPVVPGYKAVGMSINGVDASLNVIDVLGTTGLKISDPESNTISISKGGPVHAIESTVGVVTYMVATTDGQAKAHVRASVSGLSEITNTKTYFENSPPPPPPPRPRDPLTAWIEVYVNGQLRQVGGSDKTQIFFSSSPDESHQSGTLGQHSTFHTASFSYPATVVFDTISVPVREADFVEFYFYNNIRAEGSVPPTPPGFHTYSQHGQATATAKIQYASINTSM